MRAKKKILNSVGSRLVKDTHQSGTLLGRLSVTRPGERCATGVLRGLASDVDSLLLLGLVPCENDRKWSTLAAKWAQIGGV
jgi:hypothetical protein